METLQQRLDWLPNRLNELLERYNIPGGSIAVWHDGDQYSTAAGYANVPARIEATTDTLFLIGSITKVYTATLVMQLVERDLVDLDAPVKSYVPDLELSDAEMTETVTVRHLLTHTSGIAGDYLPDCGRGDDVLVRYVASLDEAPKLHQPGEMLSYCNSGFILAGRLVEYVTGESWDTVLRTHLLDPLGSRSFATLPEEALLHRVGVGHTPDPETGEQQLGQMWPELRSGGPAGFTPFATASDLVRFARLHLNDGRAESGEQLLQTESVAAMQAHEVLTAPSGSFDNDGWGLGWSRLRYSDGERVIGHNGGASAMLRVLPERNFAIASLTNATGGTQVGHYITDAIVDELFGLYIPTAPEPAASSLDLSRYEGTYRHHTALHQVAATNGELTVTSGDHTSAATLQAIDETYFVAHMPGFDVPNKAAFLAPNADGKPAYFHIGGRACLREG